jgi:hypothetical protein
VPPGEKSQGVVDTAAELRETAFDDDDDDDGGGTNELILLLLLLTPLPTMT